MLFIIDYSITHNFIELDKAMVHMIRLVSFLWLCFSVCLPSDGGEGNGTPLQYSCLENPVDRGAWWAAVHGVAKRVTQLSNFTFTFLFHALEKEMATHSSVLAWRIPGKLEPGGMTSMGLHRVRHYWSDLAAAAVEKQKGLDDPHFPTAPTILTIRTQKIFQKCLKRDLKLGEFRWTFWFRSVCKINIRIHERKKWFMGGEKVSLHLKKILKHYLLI